MSFVFAPLMQAYLTIPACMMFAKCVPHSLEGLMMGLITSIIKFNQDILMRLFAYVVMINSDVSIEDYTGLSYKFLLFFGYSLLGLLALPFVVDRNDFSTLQAIIAKLPSMSPAELKNLNIQQKEEIKEKRRIQSRWRAKQTIQES